MPLTDLAIHDERISGCSGRRARCRRSEPICAPSNLAPRVPRLAVASAHSKRFRRSFSSKSVGFYCTVSFFSSAPLHQKFRDKKKNFFFVSGTSGQKVMCGTKMKSFFTQTQRRLQNKFCLTSGPGQKCVTFCLSRRKTLFVTCFRCQFCVFG